MQYYQLYFVCAYSTTILYRERYMAKGSSMSLNTAKQTGNIMQPHPSTPNTKRASINDLRLLWARVHREFFKNSPNLFDPVIPGKKYIEEFEKFMIKKFDLFGSFDKANQILLNN